MGWLIGDLGVQAAFWGRKNKGGGRRTVKKQPALFNFIETVLSGSLKMVCLKAENCVHTAYSLFMRTMLATTSTFLCLFWDGFAMPGCFPVRIA